MKNKLFIFTIACVTVVIIGSFDAFSLGTILGGKAVIATPFAFMGLLWSLVAKA